MLRLALFFILANIIQQSTGSLANRDTPNQCDQLGLTTLQLITAIIPELNSKLQRIHDDQLALKTNLIAMQSSLEAQRTRKLARTEDLEELRTQLDAQFLAIQRKLDEQQTSHRESLSNTITREDFEARFNETEDHFDEIQSTLAKLDVPAENPRETHLTNYSKPIPPKFQKIGDRYFYIENNITGTWFKAAATCHQMGGYLAGIKTQKELFTIQTYLEDNASYWLGINDLMVGLEYYSVASGKPAATLLWGAFSPDEERNCVQLYNGRMGDYSCNYNSYFICQADSEV